MHTYFYLLHSLRDRGCLYIVYEGQVLRSRVETSYVPCAITDADFVGDGWMIDDVLVCFCPLEVTSIPGKVRGKRERGSMFWYARCRRLGGWGDGDVELWRKGGCVVLDYSGVEGRWLVCCAV